MAWHQSAEGQTKGGESPGASREACQLRRGHWRRVTKPALTVVTASEGREHSLGWQTGQGRLSRKEGGGKKDPSRARMLLFRPPRVAPATRD